MPISPQPVSDVLLMTRILILAMFLFMGLGVAWSGGWPGVTAGSRTQWILDRVHLMGIVLAAVIMLAMPSLTGSYGSPVLAYASAFVLVASLPLFSLRMRYPVNVLMPAKGTRVKPVSEQPRPSRWPFSLVWTTGYVLAGWYLATVYGQFG